MSGNATNVFSSTRNVDIVDELAAYDRLPVPVRNALANAPYRICALTLLEAIDEYNYSAETIVTVICAAVARAQREKALVPNDP